MGWERGCNEAMRIAISSSTLAILRSDFEDQTGRGLLISSCYTGIRLRSGSANLDEESVLRKFAICPAQEGEFYFSSSRFGTYGTGGPPSSPLVIRMVPDIIRTGTITNTELK